MVRSLPTGEYTTRVCGVNYRPTTTVIQVARWPILVAVDHSQLWTTASKTEGIVNPIDCRYPLPLTGEYPKSAACTVQNPSHKSRMLHPGFEPGTYNTQGQRTAYCGHLLVFLTSDIIMRSVC